MSETFLPDLPHSRCNYITEDGLILVGAKPTRFTIADILKTEVDVFVNLMEEEAEYSIPDNVQIIHIPTKRGEAPDLEMSKQLVEFLISAYKKRYKIYIHCNGGHGRAGTFAAFLMGMISRDADLAEEIGPMDAKEAVEYIENAREARTDKTRNFIPTPESNKQIKFLVDNLGLKKENKRPDRSDTNWLKRVKREQKMRSKTRI